MDGVLHEIVQPPTTWAERLAARIKVMARLDVAERRVPQDGAIKVRISSTRELDLRISTLPTMFGEKIVIRLLDSTPAMLDIDRLGYEAHQKELYLEALRKPQGMILVTGPTGSGKTVSLYTGLRILNTPAVNIATAEDPCEIKLPGANQVSINTKVGLTFAAALRAFLRQDPDIIMVGEIRDLETAEIAMKAAQTGHLVLSTLHTNEAPQTLTRLLNIGVEPFNVADTVDLIIAQRLVRCLCNNCKLPHDIPEHALLKTGFTEEELRNGLQVFQANKGGCEQCAGGFKGRTGIYQVLPISEEISRIIMQGGNSMDIAAQAKREGVTDLRRSGLNKVRDGVTSLHEIYRVTVN
jgi:type IV pilus assembly protein PilB